MTNTDLPSLPSVAPLPDKKTKKVKKEKPPPKIFKGEKQVILGTQKIWRGASKLRSRCVKDL